MAKKIDVQTLKKMIRDDEELALLDVREAGQFGIDHMLHAIPCPYSTLETRVGLIAPRASVRTVLIDEGDGVAEKAAARLADMGYSDVSILDGGNPSWAAAGFEVFQGVNVPSKAFGEVVEHDANTPRITADDLHGMQEAGDNIVIVDGRTPAEHNRMSIPGGMSLPNAEMLYRIHDIAPDPETTIVVNCAGRTRSIIGAQGLINGGVPNKVVALKAGTMGWTLAGYELDHGSTLKYPDRVSDEAAALAEKRTAEMLKRFDVSSVDAATLETWRADDSRTTFLLDVRAEDEFLAGHLPGSVHAPGGQLVQATDQWCGVWQARVVLLDTAPCARAAVAGHWLRQMGWEVYVLDGGLGDLATETGAPPAPAAGAVDVDAIMPDDLAAAIEAGSVLVVDVDHSMDYRDAHLPGAVWAVRPRLDRLDVPAGRKAVFYSEHETRARLAAADYRRDTGADCAVLQGGREAWVAKGLPTESSPDVPPDEDAIDFLFWVSQRHMGSDAAARAYLEWEENLPAQVKADGDARFTVVTG
jgi:rhodanese-related sulfurtransferase